MPGERKDALAEIGAVLRRYREDILALWDQSEAEEDLRSVERALSLLPRLREVVEAAKEMADSPIVFGDPRIAYVEMQVNREDFLRMSKALAALEGEPPPPAARG